METEHDLSIQIVAITVRIQEKYPELYRNLNEMYATLPNIDTPVISRNTLKNWLETLRFLMLKYEFAHQY